MRLSPLQLERRFVTRIHIEASPSAAERNKGNLSTSVNCQPHGKDPRKWFVTLAVGLSPEKPDHPIPYTVDIEIVGFFVVLESFPEKDVHALVLANAPALLFGAAREIVATLTAKGPHPRVDLPTVTFVDAIDQGKGRKKTTLHPRAEVPTKRARRTR